MVTCGSRRPRIGATSPDVYPILPFRALHGWAVLTGFFSSLLGLEYYIAARYSWHAKVAHSCGIQFHIAVEMLLKGFICRTLSGEGSRFHLQPDALVDYLTNRHRHNVPRMWRWFKNSLSDASLAQFDHAVDSLQTFYTIRYPDKLAFEGGVINLPYEESDIGIDDSGLAAYKLSLVPLDRLPQQGIRGYRGGNPFGSHQH